MPIVKKKSSANASKPGRAPKGPQDKRTAALSGYASTMKNLLAIRDLPPWLINRIHTEAQEWLRDQGTTATLDEIIQQQQSIEERLLELYTSKMSNEYARKDEDAEYAQAERMKEEAHQALVNKEKEDDGLVIDTTKYGYAKRWGMAQSEKELGGAAFKEKDYKEAAKHWTCATNHLQFLDLKTMTEVQAADVLKMTAALHSNMALACLKGCVWDHCIQCCDKVMALKEIKGGPWQLSDTDLAKACYRKGMSLSQGFREWDLAIAALEQAQQINPLENKTEEVLIINQIERCKKSKQKEEAYARKKQMLLGQYMLSGFDDEKFKIAEKAHDPNKPVKPHHMGIGPKQRPTPGLWEYESNEYKAYDDKMRKEDKEKYGEFPLPEEREPLKLIRLNRAFAALGEDDGDDY